MDPKLFFQELQSKCAKVNLAEKYVDTFNYLRRIAESVSDVQFDESASFQQQIHFSPSRNGGASVINLTIDFTKEAGKPSGSIHVNYMSKYKPPWMLPSYEYTIRGKDGSNDKCDDDF